VTTITATQDSTAETSRPWPIAGKYSIDPSHSRLGFVARHAMITKVRGSFNDFSGSGEFDPENQENSHVEIEIQAASIDTRNSMRDDHLRSNDFFDMEKWPTLTFASTEVLRVNDEVFRVVGDLVTKGVTKPVAIDFEYTGNATDPYGNKRVGFEGSVVVNRSDWGIVWNGALEQGGVLVGEKVTLEFEISAILED